MTTLAPGTVPAPPVDAGTSSDVVAFTVFGQCVSLKNRRRILKNMKTGKPFSAKSSDATRYIQDFCAQVPMKYRNLKLGSAEAFIEAKVTVFYQSYRSDVDVEIAWDCLQLAGVVSNDRWIRKKEVDGLRVDPKNPRVEIELRISGGALRSQGRIRELPLPSRQ